MSYVLRTAALTGLSLIAACAHAQVALTPAWTLTSNVALTSDYYSRGISQSWHNPAIQGGVDLVHRKGLYTGAWASSVSPNTYPDANTEIDAYLGYNGTVSRVKDLGWTAGLYGYFYPGGSWRKYIYYTVPNVQQTPDGGNWNTQEANLGASYKWLSTKASVTLTNWYGAKYKTGWEGKTRGTTYIELNANYPIAKYDLALLGHVGRLHVRQDLNTSYKSSSGEFPSATTLNTSPDITDYKVGVTKNFKLAGTPGWSANVAYIGTSKNDYWSSTGYGGSSFDGRSEGKNLNARRAVVTLARTF